MCEYIILEVFKMDKYIYDKRNGLWYAKNDWGYTPIELARKLQYRADLLKRMTE